MTNKYFFIGSLTLALGLSSCHSESAEYPSTSAATPAASVSIPSSAVRDSTPSTASASPAPTQQQAPVATAAEQGLTTLQLLQGKWKSTEDESDVIEIRNYAYMDYYDNKQLSTSTFVLDKACPGEAESGNPGDNEKFLVMKAKDMCWEVVVVDEQSLELSYTASGNSLVYIKIK